MQDRVNLVLKEQIAYGKQYKPFNTGHDDSLVVISLPCYRLSCFANMTSSICITTDSEELIEIVGLVIGLSFCM